MSTAEYLKLTSGKGSKASKGAGGVVEKDIQDSILEYLAYKRILAWRNNTGAARFPGANGGKDRFIRFSRPGASDIFAIRHGQFIAIEVKKPGGILSDKQREFLDEVKEAGGIAIVAFSLADVEKLI